MLTYESVRLILLKYLRVGLAKFRKKQLNVNDFTIISNNCWGGMIYESYDLPKNTPTVGLFFVAKDYIEFLTDLKGYINCNLTFIKPENSRWKNMSEISEDKRFGSYPIGILSNKKNTIEIFFLHYKSELEAKEKWERRIQRINWDKLLVKFNDQNGCTEIEVDKFIKLPYKNKLFFTCKQWKNIETMPDGFTVIHQFPKYDSVMASYEPFGKNRYIDITSIINHL